MCVGKTKNGNQCKLQPDKEYCYKHIYLVDQKKAETVSEIMPSNIVPPSEVKSEMSPQYSTTKDKSYTIDPNVKIEENLNNSIEQCINIGQSYHDDSQKVWKDGLCFTCIFNKEDKEEVKEEVKPKVKCAAPYIKENDLRNIGPCDRPVIEGEYCSYHTKYPIRGMPTYISKPIEGRYSLPKIISESSQVKFDLNDNPNGWNCPINFDIQKELIQTEKYIKYDTTLITIFKEDWFKQSDNIFKLVGYFRNKPHSSSEINLYTYLSIIKFKNNSEYFNLSRAAADWNTWTNKNWISKFGLREIKQIAGGSNPEKYVEWKNEYEPEFIKESKNNKKSDKPLDILKNYLRSICHGKYRREFNTGVIYEHKLDYYYTRKYEDPIKFLNVVFADNEIYAAIGSSIHKELIYWIKHIADSNFEFVKIDYEYIGFENGIYDLNTAKFILTESITKSIQVRKMINQNFNIGDTPLLDNYLQFQFENPDDIEFIYFLLGRTMTRLDDRFDFMLLFYGAGGSGKSLLMKLISYAFSQDQIGILSSSFQGQFGLCEFANRQLVCCDDMPNNLAKTLDKGDFLKMMTRGSISCPVKGKSSIEVHDWNIPTIINSNRLPNYKDESGEIVRRVMIINFENVVPENQKNTNLESDIIKSEICTFIHKCRSTYLKYKTQYHGKGVESFCPKTFLENRLLLRLEVNNTCRFIDEKFEYDAEAYISLPDLNRMFKNWMKERFDLQRAPSDKINIQSIQMIDNRFICAKINTCKHCSNEHKKGCCSKYNRTERSSRDVIRGLNFKPNN